METPDGASTEAQAHAGLCLAFASVHSRERTHIAGVPARFRWHLQGVLVGLTERMLDDRHHVAEPVNVGVEVRGCRFRAIGRRLNPRQLAGVHVVGPDHVVLVQAGILTDNQRVIAGYEGDIVRFADAVQVALVGRVRATIRVVDQRTPAVESWNAWHHTVNLCGCVVVIQFQRIDRTCLLYTSDAADDLA